MTIQLTNLHEPINNIYYSKECLERAFNEPIFKCRNAANKLPVKLDDGTPIGYAHAVLDYPKITIDFDVEDKYMDRLFIDSIRFDGYADADYDSNPEHVVVDNMRITHIEVYSKN